MCGLSVLVRRSSAAWISQIRAFTQAIRHRGPDDEGFALVQDTGRVVFAHGADTPPGSRVDPRNGAALVPVQALSADGAGLALGHRRLSIVDLSDAAHQPMLDADTGRLIVFNGEIYNHVELRSELEAAGRRFRSRSDTEVILAAFEKWGPSCLDRFNGMFAFVMVDPARRRLFAARDRFGVKPLYLWWGPDGDLAMASEIKQFAALREWRARLNRPRAYDYLVWGLTDHDSTTLFDGVRSLGPGECVETGWSEAGPDLEFRRWYDLHPSSVELSPEATVSRFRDLLEDAVALRLRADVPVGTGFSGGLDSSSIVCLIHRILQARGKGEQQNAFSACATEERIDERPFMDEVIRLTGVRSHRVFPELEDLRALSRRITWHQDEPFLSTSILAEWKVFDLVSTTEVKVTLDGHGADEQLGGYVGEFMAAVVASMARGGRWERLWREVRELRQGQGLAAASLAKWWLYHTLPESLRQPLLGLVGRPTTPPAWICPDHLPGIPADPLVRYGLKGADATRLSRIMLARTSLPRQLHWCDRDSMAHSIESRAPFLDYRLVEFTAGLPDEFRLSGGWSKRILRDSMKGILPEAVRRRGSKIGFETPEHEWVRRDPEYFREGIRGAIRSSGGILRPSVEGILDRLLSGATRYDSLIWRLHNFAEWSDVFKVSA